MSELHIYVSHAYSISVMRNHMSQIGLNPSHASQISNVQSIASLNVLNGMLSLTVCKSKKAEVNDVAWH